MNIKLVMWHNKDEEIQMVPVAGNASDDEAVKAAIAESLPGWRLVKNFKGRFFEGDLFVHEDIADEDIPQFDKDEVVPWCDGILTFEIRNLTLIEPCDLEILEPPSAKDELLKYIMSVVGTEDPDEAVTLRFEGACSLVQAVADAFDAGPQENNPPDFTRHATEYQHCATSRLLAAAARRLNPGIGE